MILTRRWPGLTATVVLLMLASPVLRGEDAASNEGARAQVSYYHQVRPILQAHCHGCHQPAKPRGQYAMTSFDRLLAGGESETPAIVPYKPEESYLLELITPVDGQAEMPQGKHPLASHQIQLIRQWILQGAVDDTPASAGPQYDMDHPPVYTLPPVITSLDFSPDGKLLAVAGYHEVLLHRADGSGLVARLVGMSERIESVRFSPDGNSLAVTGGLPARMGEVQIWDVGPARRWLDRGDADRPLKGRPRLKRSLSVTYDTVYGANWSPDGKLVSFGCTDNTIRAIEVETGKQVLYQGAHNDWPLDTVFSLEGTHLISVGRDRTAKLTEVATQRFVDNITSITPGALKGGIASVARHPCEDVIVVGGADGAPKLFRVFRQSRRVIGDDANLIRRFPPLIGRVFGVAFSRDGRRIAAVSSYNGKGAVKVYAYQFQRDVPDEIAAIVRKRSAQRSDAEKRRLAEYHRQGVRVVAEATIEQSGLYAVAFHPDGQTIAAAGTDGAVRLLDAATGSVRKQFVPVPLAAERRSAAAAAPNRRRRAPSIEQESLPPGQKLVSIEVQPAEVRISHRYDTVQFVVSGHLASGDTVDVTRMVAVRSSNDVAAVSPTGLLHARSNGRAELTFSLGGLLATADVVVAAPDGVYRPDFIRDVAPVLSKLGCNAGTCHGANKGKAGFKLSLRGNNAEFDVRAFADDLACRRVNFASPDDSLTLLKATARVPHEGGQLMQPGEPYWVIIRQWIAQGARLNRQSPRVERIAIFPQDPIVQRIGAKQQFRVVATYANGEVRDVTAEAFIESANTEVAVADQTGLLSVLRRGEAPVLARYEGRYAATTLTVMGDRAGFVWVEPPANNFIDQLVAEKLRRTKTLPSKLCTDAEFIRRVYLDLTGLPPTAADVRAFLADPRDTRVKRDALIDRLIGSEEYIEHWTNKWADLLQVNRKYLGAEGAKLLRRWIRAQVAQNTPYDQLAYQILTATGSNRENPPAAYYKIHRTPEEVMETTTHLFLGIRFNCNKCHDHPFERWIQDQYYETAAFFAQVGRKRDPASGKRKVGGTAVEGAKPLYEIIFDTNQGEVRHARTGAVTPPKLPFQVAYEVPEGATRRERIARWITSPHNPYFAKSYVNRIWAYLLGVGLIEPIDDIRAGNPPTNPELLDRLTREFLASGLDVQQLIRTICKSRTYQRSIETNRWNEDDRINYSHAVARRLPAEVLYDALHRVTGSTSKFGGAVPDGTRAAQLPDAGVKEPDGFLAKLGRPPRESPCECERSRGLQFGPVLALVTGPTVGKAISDPNNQIAKLVAAEPNDTRLVNQLFLRILNRPATEAEIAACLAMLQRMPAEHQALVAEMHRYEKQIAPPVAQREQQRQAAIEQAQAALAAYQKQIAPREAERDRQQKEEIARLEAVLARYEQLLPEKLAAWEARDNAITRWQPLDPVQLASTSATTLTRQKDLSVVATSSNGVGAYKFVAHTELIGITAVRLEVLTDDRQPKRGPGRAPDGNFVLSELELTAAPRSAPDKATKVALRNAQADFSQKRYAVATAIDGKVLPRDNGWAIAPQVGKNHLACFDTAQPVGYEGGTVLTFTLHQRFRSGRHSIGRFRISVTTTPGPTLLDGLPKPIASILAIPRDQRDEKQQEALLEYYRRIDTQLRKHQRALAQRRRPRPVDPKLQQLRDELARVRRPLPLDPKLARLRRDVQLSTKQLASRRLTAAQDIAWALINSPAFLFNR